MTHLLLQYLQPIVIKTESYIQDSQNFIQQTKDIVFKNKPYLYSLDIVSLYTNMKALDVINRISVFMINHLNSLNLNIHGFRKLLFIMFNTNVFKVNSKYYKQIDGLPMGCICGPTVANLYVYILEKEWFKIERPLIYKRFIDDTAIALYKELNIEKFQKFFYNLKFTVNTGDCIEFLDLIISFDIITNKLKFSVHIKPTNTFGYLKVNSNHPKHIFKNIAKSILIRNRRICTNYNDYIAISKLHIDNLVKRGYEREFLIKLCKSIGNIDRDSLLPYKEKTNNLTVDNKINIMYFQLYNYNINFASIINYSFNSILYNSKFNFIYINKINCNINNALVHNFKIIKHKRYQTKKCNLLNCKICRFIHTHHFIKLDIHSNLKLKLISNATCMTKNVIYIIICKKCNLFYVGETSDTLKARISQHLNHILKFKPYEKYHDKEVARHFRRDKHKLSDLKVCVFRADLSDTKLRKYLELDLINRLNINKKRCINTFKSNLNKKFIFKI
jgi:hypothetical protein